MKLLIGIMLYFNIKICYVLLTKIIPVKQFGEITMFFYEMKRLHI